MKKQHEELREAIKIVSEAEFRGPLLSAVGEVLRAARKELRRMPVEKRIVEVWRIEFAKRENDGTWLPEIMPIGTELEGHREVEVMRGDENYAFVCLTGPHKQEVPS